MSAKQEQTYGHSSLSHALNAVEQYSRMIRSTLDTSSPSQREARLEVMAHLIAHAIELQAEEWERSK